LFSFSHTFWVGIQVLISQYLLCRNTSSPFTEASVVLIFFLFFLPYYIYETGIPTQKVWEMETDILIQKVWENENRYYYPEGVGK
jgi:p-aminobenzoyl-glutamate transporter AbgT